MLFVADQAAGGLFPNESVPSTFCLQRVESRRQCLSRGVPREGRNLLIRASLPAPGSLSSMLRKLRAFINYVISPHLDVFLDSLCSDFDRWCCARSPWSRLTLPSPASTRPPTAAEPLHGCGVCSLELSLPLLSQQRIPFSLKKLSQFSPGPEHLWNLPTTPWRADHTWKM